MHTVEDGYIYSSYPAMKDVYSMPNYTQNHICLVNNILIAVTHDLTINANYRITIHKRIEGSSGNDDAFK